MCVPRPARCDHSEPRMSRAACVTRQHPPPPRAAGPGGPRRWAAHHRPCVCRARRVAIAASRACPSPHRFTRSHLHCVKRFLITGAPGTHPRSLVSPKGGDSGSGLRPEPGSALTVAVCPCSLSHGNRRDSLRLPTAPPADTPACARRARAPGVSGTFESGRPPTGGPVRFESGKNGLRRDFWCSGPRRPRQCPCPTCISSIRQAQSGRSRLSGVRD